ncbi:PIF1 [Mytilus edulis]|uniref:ATP-dependent DNA helicase n=1 Tax=Mytilus edulis TaxID=6550 RepID=A0A8S3RJC2_MYTED|nr:PIF1 [Mytilus edulis]
MDEDQKFAFNLAVNGHNLLISGQAGTGKTFLVEKIVEFMRYSQKKNVSIVCSTGIAATHYGNLGAQTLHKWSGIRDGRYLIEEIVHLLRTDERYTVAKSNIESVETLIIDEISMVSSKVLNQVQVLCRQIRNSPDIFGNIQVILVGDFYQLPPVSNELYGDPGNLCFRLPWFESYFPHKINLHIVHRQDEHNLITCINELEVGDPSDESVAFLQSLNRPLQDEAGSVQLFARNIDVDMFNYNKLNQIQGELQTYHSVDEGSAHYINKFLAPKNLGLKVGCPVMLIKNLSDVLVNGVRGIAVQLHNKSVDVNFKIGEKIVTANIGAEIFSTYDPVGKIIIAKRIQLPLKLAYALTIHKAQGMSLENVTVNCQHSVQPGQLGVAVGRAVSVNGLKVVNFKKHLCKKHPGYVLNFYESFSVGELNQDLTCCRNKTQLEKLSYSETESASSDSDACSKTFEKDFIDFDNDSDFSDSEIEKLEFLDTILTDDNQKVFSTDPLPSKLAFDNVLLEFLDTPAEEQILYFKELILKNFNLFNDWFDQQASIIDDIGLNCFPEDKDKYTQKHRNDFFIKFNKHINSEEYECSTSVLLKKYELQELKGPAYRLLTSVLFYIERKFFETLSSHLHLTSPEPLPKPSLTQELDPAGKGKIRYISGYVIAKLKHNLSQKIRNSLFAKGKEKELKDLQNKMNILNSMCCTFGELVDVSTDKTSLDEIKRKQNQREGLTNISDSAFDFFQKLEIQCRQKLTHENLVIYGKNLYNDSLKQLFDDYELYEAWLMCVTSSVTTSSEDECENDHDIRTLLNSMATAVDNFLILFQSVVTLFLKVSLSQFRRDFLAFLKREKGKALRKKVTEKGKKSIKKFDMKFYTEDKSTNKQSSFLRLKSELLQNPKYLNDYSFTKKDLLLICKDIKIKISSQKRKEEITNVLAKKILDSDTCIETLNIPDSYEPQPGPSGISQSVPVSEQSVHDDMIGPSGSLHVSSEPETSLSGTAPSTLTKTKRTRNYGKKKSKGKGKGKGKKTKKVEETIEDENCAICNKTYIDGEDWINCDVCTLWFHRQCVNLEDEAEWACLTEEDGSFTCPLCL